MHASLPASMKRIGSKTAEKKWQHCLFHYNPISCHGNQSRIWPNFNLIQALMFVIFTCKYEKDLMKNSREIVMTSLFPITTLWDFFSNPQGQLTPLSVVESGQISNSSKPMGAICCHGNQSSDLICIKLDAAFPPPR